MSNTICGKMLEDVRVSEMSSCRLGAIFTLLPNGHTYYEFNPDLSETYFLGLHTIQLTI